LPALLLNGAHGLTKGFCVRTRARIGSFRVVLGGVDLGTLGAARAAALGKDIEPEF